ncbi:MAG: hypothetical protein IT452_13630 [Planctomycetia bacterium]|nr:hypothetical protein [Planctomycetia bacterium]
MPIGLRKGRLFLPSLFLLAPGLASAQAPLPISNRGLLELPEDVAAAREFAVSAGGAHAAVAAQTKSGRFVMLTEGGRSAEHEAIWSLVAAPGPQPRFAYAASDREEASGAIVTRVFCDGEAGPALQQLLEGPFFDPSGKRLAYVGIMPDHLVRLVLDGKVLEDRERRSFAFSPKGGGWACAEEKQLRWCARFGTCTGGECDDVSLVTVSPDGERLAWVGKVGADTFVMADGERRPDLVRISELHWLPSGRDVAYCGELKPPEGAANAEARWVVVRGKEETRTDGFPRDAQFSADEKHLLFWVGASTPGERWSLVCDGKVLGTSFEPGPAAFSPDGGTVAWVRTDGDGARWLHAGDARTQLGGRVPSLEWNAEGTAVSFAVCSERALTWVTARTDSARPR